MPDDSREKLTKIEELTKDWIKKQGHDKCWYYPEIFREIANVLGIQYEEPTLVSENEFREGCEKYRKELYHAPTIEGKINPID